MEYTSTSGQGQALPESPDSHTAPPKWYETTRPRGKGPSSPPPSWNRLIRSVSSPSITNSFSQSSLESTRITWMFELTELLTNRHLLSPTHSDVYTGEASSASPEHTSSSRSLIRDSCSREELESTLHSATLGMTSSSMHSTYATQKCLPANQLT